jgi:hypothetical protein
MEALAVNSLALGDSHGTKRTPMVSALHGDNVLLPRDGPSHLDGSLDGF